MRFKLESLTSKACKRTTKLAPRSLLHSSNTISNKGSRRKSRTKSGGALLNRVYFALGGHGLTKSIVFAIPLKSHFLYSHSPSSPLSHLVSSQCDQKK